MWLRYSTACPNHAYPLFLTSSSSIRQIFVCRFSVPSFLKCTRTRKSCFPIRFLTNISSGRVSSSRPNSETWNTWHRSITPIKLKLWEIGCSSSLNKVKTNSNLHPAFRFAMKAQVTEHTQPYTVFGATKTSRLLLAEPRGVVSLLFC